MLSWNRKLCEVLCTCQEHGRMQCSSLILPPATQAVGACWSVRHRAYPAMGVEMLHTCGGVSWGDDGGGGPEHERREHAPAGFRQPCQPRGPRDRQLQLGSAQQVALGSHRDSTADLVRADG